MGSSVSNNVDGDHVVIDNKQETEYDTTTIFTIFNFHIVSNILGIAFITLILVLCIIFFRFRILACWYQIPACFKCLRGKPNSVREGECHQCEAR